MRIRRPLGTVTNTNANPAVQNPPHADHESVANKPASKTTSKKRKSSEAGPSTSAPASSAKKAKTTSSSKDAVKKLAKEIAKNAASDLLDVSDIVYLDDGDVPIYDTCDTVRRKIRAILAKDGITQAAFLRAIVAAAYGEGSTKKIQSASLNTFLKQKGPLQGNTSAVYYAAYVFFEKRRVKDKKPKSKDREIMEGIHFDGVDTKVVAGNVRYIGSASSKLGMDKYGRVFSY